MHQMTSLKRIFAVACVGTALPNLDLFSVNIALPSIAADFPAAALDDLSWVLNAYAIAYAALLVFLGRLAESSRRDRSFMLGIALFCAGSAGSAFAHQLSVLVACRVLTAAGAALMTPTSIGLLLATHPPDKRGAAVRNWAGVGGLAAALGPLVGGALVYFDWRLVFAFNALFGGVALAVARHALPGVPGSPSRPPSPLAALLITGGIAAMIFAIVKGNAWGWRSVGVSVSAGASALMLLAFAWHCVASKNPLIEPSLFRIRPFTGATLAMVPYSVSFGAMLFSVAVWGQSAWGWTALEAGLAIIPGPMMVPITSSLVTGRLVERHGPASAVTLGVALIVLGFIGWSTLIGLEPNRMLVMGGMLLNGIGVGLVFPALMGAGTQALPPDSFSTGSALINMLRQSSIAVGVAVFVAIIGTQLSALNRLDAFRLGWQVMTAVTLLTLIPTHMLLRKRNAP